MRKVLIIFWAFFTLILPVQADSGDDLTLSIVFGPVQYFAINNAGPLTFTYDQYSDFGSAQDIGDVNYDLTSNTAWEVTCLILDDTTSGQTADNWDDSTWTLSVNAVAVNETLPVVIDSDGNPVLRTGELWEVLLTIPWSEGPSNPDCVLEITASTV